MKIVFLHIPKTAGSSVIAGIKSSFRPREISPIRSHTQAEGSCFAEWSRYSVYAGHLDWMDLAEQPDPKFVFSILRDPKERVASFYFYLFKEAERLSQSDLERPENAGKRAILTMSADDYFLGGTGRWQVFVRDHYDNFYCSYFARRKFRAGADFHKLHDNERIAQARAGLYELDYVCSMEDLDQLENRLCAVTGKRVSFASRSVNRGPMPRSQSRWEALCDRLGSDKAVSRLQAFTALDALLFEEVSRTT